MTQSRRLHRSLLTVLISGLAAVMLMLTAVIVSVFFTPGRGKWSYLRLKVVASEKCPPIFDVRPTSQLIRQVTPPLVIGGVVLLTVTLLGSF